MWPPNEFGQILPPTYKRDPGRPKKLRRREPDEDNNNRIKLRRENTTYECKRCGGNGHNVRTCPQPPAVVEESATEEQANAEPATERDPQPVPAANVGPKGTNKRGKGKKLEVLKREKQIQLINLSKKRGKEWIVLLQRRIT